VANIFFFSSRRRHTRFSRDWSSDVCSSDLMDNSYKEVTEPSTTYKYPVEGQENTYLLAWSTTPWNKLATPALAVNPDLTYVKVRSEERRVGKECRSRWSTVQCTADEGADRL